MSSMIALARTFFENFCKENSDSERLFKSNVKFWSIVVTLLHNVYITYAYVELLKRNLFKGIKQPV